MKKLLTLLLVLILSLSVAITLVACGNNGDGGDDGAADGDTNNENANGAGGTDNGDADNGESNGGNAGGSDSSDGNGSESGGNAGGSDTASYFNEDGELILYKDGKPTFRFVVGSGVGSVGVEIGNIISDLNALSGATVKQVTTAEGPVPVEILIGTVNNRGEEYKINKYDLGREGYIVKK